VPAWGSPKCELLWIFGSIQGKKTKIPVYTRIAVTTLWVIFFWLSDVQKIFTLPFPKTGTHHLNQVIFLVLFFFNGSKFDIFGGTLTLRRMLRALRGLQAPVHRSLRWPQRRANPTAPARNRTSIGVCPLALQSVPS
jgi:hypothetical protein